MGLGLLVGYICSDRCSSFNDIVELPFPCKLDILLKWFDRHVCKFESFCLLGMTIPGSIIHASQRFFLETLGEGSQKPRIPDMILKYTLLSTPSGSVKIRAMLNPIIPQESIACIAKRACLRPNLRGSTATSCIGGGISTATSSISVIPHIKTPTYLRVVVYSRFDRPLLYQGKVVR